MATLKAILQAGRRAGRDPGALPDDHALFVLGAARSGTTVLQNALNHSPDIFLLGEPDLHLDEGSPGFAGRYEARHRSWGNQETKSTRLPPAWREDGPWEAHLAWLAQRHRWVGAKIVLNAGAAASERLVRFHAQRFYGARHLFTFRSPVAVVQSTHDLQVLSGAPADDPRTLMGHYAAVYTRMLRTFPNVRALCHEDVAPPTFDALGEWLGVPLDGAARYYHPERVRVRKEANFVGEDLNHLRQLEALYADLRAMVLEGVATPQLEQNDANFDPAHYTALGSIDRRARVIANILGTYVVPPSAL